VGASTQREGAAAGDFIGFRSIIQSDLVGRGQPIYADLVLAGRRILTCRDVGKTLGGLGDAVSLELLGLGQLRQRGFQRVHFFGDAVIGFDACLIGGLAAGKVLVLGGTVGLHKLVSQGLYISTAVDHVNTSSSSPKSYVI